MNSNDKIKSSSDEALKQADVVAKVEGEVEREFKGWEFMDEIFGKCRSCNKKLFAVVKVTKSFKIAMVGFEKAVALKKQRFKSNCPFCGDESWPICIEGEVLAGPVDETMMVDAKCGDPTDDAGMLTELVLEKNNGDIG